MNMRKALKVIFVEIATLLIGIISGFLLPKVLSVDEYTTIKTFGLYVIYSGLPHLGFSDGMYIVLGGKRMEELDKEKIRGYFNTLIKILSITTIFMLAGTLFIKDNMYLAFVVYTIPFQIVLFFGLLLRATGSFDKYSLLRGSMNALNLVSILIVVFVCKSAVVYVEFQILIQIVLAIICTTIFMKNYRKPSKINLGEFKYLISLGAAVLIGNLVSTLIFSLDRWIIKLRFSTLDFAYYSFGVSMLNLFLVLIGAVTAVLFPYFAKYNSDKKMINKLKTMIELITFISLSGYFCLQFIVEQYIPKYIPSLQVLSVLICCIPFVTVTNVIYSNLYKVKRNTKRYTIVAIEILIVAFIVNVCLLLINNKPIMLAFGSLISLIIWFFYSSRDFDDVVITKKEIIFISTILIIYNGLKAFGFNPIISFIIYLIAVISLEWIFYKDDLKYLCMYVLKNIIKKQKLTK